jgi:hypothetical protein
MGTNLQWLTASRRSPRAFRVLHRLPKRCKFVVRRTGNGGWYINERDRWLHRQLVAMQHNFTILALWVAFALLLFLQLIRIRLHRRHPSVYTSLGKPQFLESNTSATYWAFQRFVWWGHISGPSDIMLHLLCVIAVASELGVVILFVLSLASLHA